MLMMVSPFGLIFSLLIILLVFFIFRKIVKMTINYMEKQRNESIRKERLEEELRQKNHHL